MADSIHQALEALPTDSELFGVKKTFIARLFPETDMEPAELKAELVRQHQLGNITLARCDMVAGYDLALVRSSEINAGMATFHFIEW